MMIDWGTWNHLASFDAVDYVSQESKDSRWKCWKHYNWLTELGLNETATIVHVQFLLQGLESRR